VVAFDSRYCAIDSERGGDLMTSTDCRYNDGFYCAFIEKNEGEPTPDDCHACALMQIVDFLVYVVGPYFHNSDPDGPHEEASKTFKIRVEK
jgi:hypothetical protein